MEPDTGQPPHAPNPTSITFLQPNQSLLDGLAITTLGFQSLAELFPQNCSPNTGSFMNSTLVCRNPVELDVPLVSPSQSTAHVMQTNLRQLWNLNMMNYVQCLGYESMNGILTQRHMNFGRTILFQSEICKILSTSQLMLLLTNYTVLLEYKNSHVQVAGLSLYQHYNFKLLGQRKRGVQYDQATGSIRSKADAYDKPMQPFNRHQIYYCNHTGRQPGIFRKNIYFLKGIIPAKRQQLKQLHELLARPVISKFIESLTLDAQEKANFIYVYSQYLKNTRKLIVQQYNPKTKTRHSDFSKILRSKCPLPPKYRQYRIKVNEYHASLGDPQQLFDQLYQGASSYIQVTHFLQKIAFKVLPSQLLGHKNTIEFCQKLKQFIVMKRFQNMKIQDVVSNFIPHEPAWLENVPKNRRQIRRNPYALKRARCILSLVVRHLFLQLIMPIIKYNFYVTQKHKQANKTFYYLKPLWILISKLALKKFTQQNIQQVSSDLSKNYPQGKLRLMPKKGSFRPIITFNRKTSLNKNFKQNLNQLLGDTQLVLRNFKQILGRDFGYCVFDNRQISERLDKFTRSWRHSGQYDLSFFSLDIKKCYDSIDTSLLLQFIRQTTLFQREYLIVKYVKLYRNKRPLKDRKSISHYFNVKQLSRAIPLSQDIMHITDIESNPSVITFVAKNKLITKQLILKHLEHICSASIVSYQNKNWLQKCGIPQGLNVSGVLCSLYFAYIQAKFVKVQTGLLMRLTDDYLYLGPKSQALEIIDGLMKSSAEYKFDFNSDKMKSNFPYAQVKELYKEKEICWIGKQVSLTTLEVYPFEQTSIQKLFYSMNVNLPKTGLHCFIKNKLKSLLTNHFSAYYKPDLFGEQVLTKIIKTYIRLSFGKFFPFIQSINRLDLTDKFGLLSSAICIALREFALYACFLHPQATHAVQMLTYLKITISSLKQMVAFFHNLRCYGTIYCQLKKLYKKRLRKMEGKLQATVIIMKQNEI